MYRGRLLATLAAAAHTASSSHPCASLSGPALQHEARAVRAAQALADADAAAPAARVCWEPQRAVRAGSLRPGATVGADCAAARSALFARPRVRLLQPGLPTVLPRAGWRSDMHSVLETLCLPVAYTGGKACWMRCRMGVGCSNMHGAWRVKRLRIRAVFC